MPGVEIDDEDHIARYCKPTSIGSNGLPLASAFEPKMNHNHLSVNWLEYFNRPDLDQAVDCVRQAFRDKEYGTSANGKFAVLRVGEVKTAISRLSSRPARVEHLPEGNDQSHSGVFGYTASDGLIAGQIAKLVRAKDLHPTRLS